MRLSVSTPSTLARQPTSSASGPSLWGTALAVWGVFQGSMMAGWFVRSVRGAWPAEVQSSFSLEIWSRSIGGFFDIITTVPLWDAFLVLLATVPFFLVACLVPLLGLVAIWQRRRDPVVVGSFAAFLSLDILELFNRGASQGVSLVGWALGAAGALGLVTAVRRDVPTSSWPFLAILALSAAVNRWWPLAFLAATAQAAWCLFRAAKRKRLEADGDEGSAVERDAGQPAAADEAQS